MKKIVVVVNGSRIVFKGEKLTAIDSSGFEGSTPDKILVIREKGENIAVFKSWDYWREVRESDEVHKQKVLIRPKTLLPEIVVKKFLKSIREGDIVMVPNSFEVIVLRGDPKIL